MRELRYGNIPSVFKDEPYERAWRLFTSRNSNGDRYYVTLTRCVRSDSAIGWSLAHTRIRIPTMTFRQGYKVRRIGGMRLYDISRALTRFLTSE